MAEVVKIEEKKKGFDFLAMLKGVNAGMQKVKNTAVKFGEIKEFVAEYKSPDAKAGDPVDENAPDWVQIVACVKRAFNLSVDLVQALHNKFQ